MTSYRISVASSADHLARQCAEQIAAVIDLTLAERDLSLIHI